MERNYLVFLCYGHDRVFHECAWALLSLSRLYSPAELANTEIWIYTDKPGWFRDFKDCPLPLHYREVNMALIKQWRGSIDFVHRVKIEILKDLTATRNGNVVYVDTDVVFTHRIDKMLTDINAGKLYMHILESIVSQERNPVLKKLSNHLKKENKQLGGKPIREMAMWNAGVLGFNTRHKALLHEVLAFTDEEHAKFSKHIIEQFAFSVYFQREGEIKAAAPYIFHYWNMKEAGVVLASFFTHLKGKSWTDLVALSSLIQLPGLMQEKANFFYNRGALNSILNRKWTPAIPDWDVLVRQL